MRRVWGQTKILTLYCTQIKTLLEKGLLFLFSTLIPFCTKDEDRVVEDQSRINELIEQIDQLRSENQSLDNMINSLQSKLTDFYHKLETLHLQIHLPKLDGRRPKIICLMLSTMERELLEHFIDMQALFLPILMNGNDLIQ